MPRVMLFARRPRLGRVKTRLAREIGDRPALALYRAFLEDQVALLGELRDAYGVELWLDGRWEPTSDGPAPDLTIRDQGSGDLGQRLARAVESAQADSAMPALLIGADAPTLPRERIDAAFARLDAADSIGAVIEPADDGGFVLLALRRHEPGLFERVPWGGPEVLGTTLRRANECGLSIHVGRGWYDIDDSRGLQRLRREFDGSAGPGRGRRSAEALASFDRRASDVV